MAENLELNLNIKGGAKATKTLGDLEKQLEKAREEIKGVEVGSAAFEKLATQIQNASSEVKTLEKQMEGLEPQQKAEAFLKMGAGGFMAAQGAMGLLGVESEELEKIQVKVQSAIAIAMGVRMMSEAALMAKTAMRVATEKLSTITTKANVVATKLATIAQKGLRNALGLSIKSLKALKVAIATTGIGALVVGIGSLISSSRRADDATSDLQNRLDKYNNLIDAKTQKVKDDSKATDQNVDFQIRLANATSQTQRMIILNEQAQAKMNKAREDNIANLEGEDAKLKSYKKTIEDLNENVALVGGSFQNLGGLLTATDLEIFGTVRATNKMNDSIERFEQNIVITRSNQEIYTQRIKDNTGSIKQLKLAKDALIKQLAEEEKQQKKNEENSKARDQKNEERKRQRLQNSKKLLSLEQEVELLSIEDDDARAKRKLEIDMENALSSTTMTSEIEAQIKEKYRLLEEQRQDEYWDKIIEKNNEFNEKKLEDDEAAAEKQKEIDESIADFKTETIAKGFEATAALFEKNKAMSKAIAVTETIYSTQQGIMAALAATSPADKLMPTPLRIANAAAVGAMGIASVRNILTDSMGDVGDIQGQIDAGADVGSMTPSSTGSFTLGNANLGSEPLKAFVVTDEMSDSQDQLANIRRRATI